ARRTPRRRRRGRRPRTARTPGPGTRRRGTDTARPRPRPRSSRRSRGPRPSPGARPGTAAARRLCTLSRLRRRRDTSCCILYRTVHRTREAETPFGGAVAGTELRPVRITVSAAANERYLATAGGSPPSLRPTAHYPPLGTQQTTPAPSAAPDAPTLPPPA